MEYTRRETLDAIAIIGLVISRKKVADQFEKMWPGRMQAIFDVRLTNQTYKFLTMDFLSRYFVRWRQVWAWACTGGTKTLLL